MPIITVSRGTLSGGRATAECLASRLGYPCVGREIVQEAAKRLGASVETLSSKFESPPRGLTLFTKDRETYLLAVQTALADQCADGNLVYHGLAGQFLLQGVPCLIRVRLIAPPEMRVRALTAAHHRTGHRAAEEFIRKMDRGRRRWVRLMYGADIDDPALYDLTINLQAISLETACTVIAELAAQPQYQVTDEAKSRLKAFAAACHTRLSKERED